MGSGAGSKWYASREGEVFGPFTLEQLAEAARRGELRAHDLVCRSRSKDWVKAGNLAELAPLFDEFVPTTTGSRVLPDARSDVSPPSEGTSPDMAGRRRIRSADHSGSLPLLPPVLPGAQHDAPVARVAATGATTAAATPEVVSSVVADSSRVFQVRRPLEAVTRASGRIPSLGLAVLGCGFMAAAAALLATLATLSPVATGFRWPPSAELESMRRMAQRDQRAARQEVIDCRRTVSAAVSARATAEATVRRAEGSQSVLMGRTDVRRAWDRYQSANRRAEGLADAAARADAERTGGDLDCRALNLDPTSVAARAIAASSICSGSFGVWRIGSGLRDRSPAELTPVQIYTRSITLCCDRIMFQHSVDRLRVLRSGALVEQVINAQAQLDSARSAAESATATQSRTEAECHQRIELASVRARNSQRACVTRADAEGYAGFCRNHGP